MLRENLIVMLSGMLKVATEEPTQHEMQHERLPFLYGRQSGTHHECNIIHRCGAFLADDLYVAAGFDGEPWLAVRDEEGGWVMAMSLLEGM